MSRMKNSTKRSQGEEFILRNELAVIIGIIAATAVCMGFSLVLWYLLNTYGSRPETGPFLLMLLTIGLGPLTRSFCGGWVAARLGSSRPMLLAMIVGAVSLAGGVMMMARVKGPAWMAIELPLYLVVAWLAGNIEQKRRAAGNTPAPDSAETGKAESDEA